MAYVKLSNEFSDEDATLAIMYMLAIRESSLSCYVAVLDPEIQAWITHVTYTYSMKAVDAMEAEFREYVE